MFIKEYSSASITQGLALSTITTQPANLNIDSMTNTNQVPGKGLSLFIAICPLDQRHLYMNAMNMWVDSSGSESRKSTSSRNT